VSGVQDQFLHPLGCSPRLELQERYFPWHPALKDLQLSTGYRGTNDYLFEIRKVRSVERGSLAVYSEVGENIRPKLNKRSTRTNTQSSALHLESLQPTARQLFRGYSVVNIDD
jgi:hypothetical protein